MNNLQSILGGISKGFNSTKTPKITRESTQAPALEWDRMSPGTQIPYLSPIPTSLNGYDPYEMQPTNAIHWNQYFASAIFANANRATAVNPANLATAVSKDQHIASDGNPDPWQKHYQIMQIMGKGYNSRSYYG